MRVLRNLNNQLVIWKQGLDFAPWHRWSVYIEDDIDHFVSGNVYFSFTKFTAWLWAICKVGNKRSWKLIRQKHTFRGE